CSRSSPLALGAPLQERPVNRTLTPRRRLAPRATGRVSFGCIRPIPAERGTGPMPSSTTSTTAMREPLAMSKDVFPNRIQPRPGPDPLALFLLGAAIPIPRIAAPAHAQNRPWCAYYDGHFGGASNCGFSTYEQCLATISGIGGWCQPNTTYVPPPGRHRHYRPIRTESSPPL